MDTRNRPERYDLSSIEVDVDGKHAELLNVSANGILVSDTGGVPHPDGSAIVADLTVPVFDHRVGLRIKGTVARHDAKGIAITFDAPAKSWPKLVDLLARKEGKRKLSA